MAHHSQGSSSLSSLSEDELPPPSSPSHPASNSTISDNEQEQEQDLLPAMPPAKKRRPNPRVARAPRPHDSPTISPAPSYDDLSSDTEGSVPPSPRAHPAGQPATQDEHALAADFVHICLWEGCPVGDLGNQDELVIHVQDAHVTQPPTTTKQKITCEWADCKSKGKPQTSAYTLKGHMKSHTKDKPHYCSLPECDRAFTRSDALAKHMRTVHDNESLRTAEHYAGAKAKLGAGLHTGTPTSGQSPAPGALASSSSAADGKDDTQPAAPAKPPAKINLKLLLAGKDKSSTSSTPSADAIPEPQSPVSPSRRDEAFGAFPSTLAFTAPELALNRKELFRLLRRQIKWAEEDAATLVKDVEEAERQRKKEWMAKELVLENLIEADVLGAVERGIVGGVQGKGGKPWELVEASTRLPLKGKDMPWYRNPGRATGLAAAVGMRADGDGGDAAGDEGDDIAEGVLRLQGGADADIDGGDDDTEMEQE